MALVNITEYSRFGVDHMGRPVQAGQAGSETIQQKTFSTTTESNNFNKGTRMVRVVADGNAAIKFGYTEDGTVTAVATDTWLIADTPEYFAIDPTRQMKCAVVTR